MPGTRTIDEIERRTPGRLALIHFGVFDDVQAHLAALRETLARWSERVEDGMDEQTFVAAARYDVSQIDPELVDEYDSAAPFWHHYRGIERYWRKRREASRDDLAVAAERSQPAPERVHFEVGERDELERRGVGCLQDDGRSDPGLKRLLPAQRDDAPTISRLEPGNIHCGCGVTRSLPRDSRELEELLGHDRADDVDTEVAEPMRQYPSRWKPVTGSSEQGSRSPPRTFTSGSLRRPPRDEPAAAAEPRRHQHEPHGDQDHERRPHAANPPVARERGEQTRAQTTNAITIETARYGPSPAPIRIPSNANTAPFSGCMSAKSGQRSAVSSSTAASPVKILGSTPPSASITQRESAARRHREPDHPLARGICPLGATRPELAPHDDLTGDRHRVEDEREEDEELERDLVRADRGLPEAGRHGPGEHERAHERARPQEDPLSEPEHASREQEPRARFSALEAPAGSRTRTPRPSRVALSPFPTADPSIPQPKP